MFFFSMVNLNIPLVAIAEPQTNTFPRACAGLLQNGVLW
jgi:hypothetical protein